VDFEEHVRVPFQEYPSFDLSSIRLSTRGTKRPFSRLDIKCSKIFLQIDWFDHWFEMITTIPIRFGAGPIARDGKAMAQQRVGSCAALCAYPRIPFRHIQMECYVVLPRAKPNAVLLSPIESGMHHQMQVLDRHKLLDGEWCCE